MEISPAPMSLCMICSQDKSSNPVAMEPGCCGKWLHLDCLKLILSAGGSRCPSCSAEFPVAFRSFGAPQPQLQQLPQPPVAFPVVEAVPYIPSHPFGNNYPNPTQKSPFSTPRPDSLSKHPEDPIEPWNPIVIADANLKSDGQEVVTGAAAISVHCLPQVPEAALTSSEKFSAVVSLAASANSGDQARTENRPPMDVVCILDVSGSMGSDNKLVNLKHAVDYIRGELSDHDRLSVVSFNSSTTVVHNLLRMNQPNKEHARRASSQLRASGGTNILSGLQAAQLILSRRQQSNPITSVFLLTDGIDSSELAAKKKTAQMLKEMGSSLFVFGFGKDHDSAHLQAIADAADGMFTFIERSDMVVDAFGGVLGAEQSIFATNIELHIRAANGSRLSQVESGVYVNHLSPDGSAAVVQFKNLMFGEERDVLVVMSVAETEGELADGQMILSTCVRYRPLTRPESEPLLEVAGGDCVIRRFSPEHLTPGISRNEIVDVQINRLLLTRTTKQSMEYADAGNYAQARAVLQEAIDTLRSSSSAGNIKTQAFIQELELALNDVRNETEFRSGGGRSNLSEKAQNYSRQRMCYAKAASPAVYQNVSSSAQQVKANKSKSGF
jgi:Mg-chelatase subunit ChlD